jgi:hypothetical protein
MTDNPDELHWQAKAERMYGRNWQEELEAMRAEKDNFELEDEADAGEVVPVP